MGMDLLRKVEFKSLIYEIRSLFMLQKLKEIITKLRDHDLPLDFNYTEPKNMLNNQGKLCAYDKNNQFICSVDIDYDSDADAVIDLLILKTIYYYNGLISDIASGLADYKHAKNS